MPITTQPALLQKACIRDGDTVDVLYYGKKERIRLLRIDTPERNELGYRQAKRALKKLSDGRKVRLEFEGPGKTERGADVPVEHFKNIQHQKIIVICDRYSAYKSLAKQLPFIIPF